MLGLLGLSSSLGMELKEAISKHGPKRSFMAVEMAFSGELCLFYDGASFLSFLAAKEAGTGMI